MRFFLTFLFIVGFNQVSANNKLTKADLKLIYEKLNLTTFRNSTAPFRNKGDKYFSDLHLPLSKITDDSLIVETENWVYTITVLEVKDFTKDGITDTAICFNDKAKFATYHAQQPLLITQLTEDGDYIALKFDIDGCAEYAN